MPYTASEFFLASGVPGTTSNSAAFQTNLAGTSISLEMRPRRQHRIKSSCQYDERRIKGETLRSFTGGKKSLLSQDSVVILKTNIVVPLEIDYQKSHIDFLPLILTHYYTYIDSRSISI